MRVVLDTNVLVSGIFFSGPPSEILKAWRDGKVQLVLTAEIINEYTRVARILAEDFQGIEIGDILTLIADSSDIIEPLDLPYQVCDDIDDDKFIACALANKSLIISGDKHLTKLSGYQGIEILTPRAFVNRHLRS